MAFTTANAIMASSAIAAALGGGSMGLASAQNRRQYKYASALMAQQYEYNKSMAQNAHQWEVSDLRAAGLNPILSANGGASTSGVSIPSFSSFDEAGALNSGASSALSALQTKSNIELQGATTAKTIEEAETQENVRANLDADTALKDMLARKTEIDKKLAEGDLKWQDRLNLQKERNMISETYRNYIGAECDKLNASANMTSAKAAETNVEINRTSSPIKLGVDALRRHAKSFEKDHPILSKTRHWKSYRNTIGY